MPIEIEAIKNVIRLNIGRRVTVCVNNGRKKNDVLCGVLTAAYPQIFTLMVSSGDADRTYSYSYSEVRTRKVTFAKSR